MTSEHTTKNQGDEPSHYTPLSAGLLKAEAERAEVQAAMDARLEANRAGVPEWAGDIYQGDHDREPDILTAGERLAEVRQCINELRNPDLMPGYENVADTIADALEHLAAVAEDLAHDVDGVRAPL